MGKIRTILVCNHSHTDIGFTDYQEVAFRQHGEFIEQALDLIEATDSYPDPARYRWTCETTGPLVRWLRNADKAQIERFRRWHAAGRIDVAAMQYNLTPLLNVEQMFRSLYPLRALRDEFGFSIESAMQDDVNGVSWLYADLLAELGVWFYSAAINPIRGARPRPFPGAFWWEGPSGKKVLAWNGYHYLFGRSQAGLGNWDLVDRFLPKWIDQLEADDNYPFDFLYCEATHPVRVDNGPPDPRMPEFVRRWNESGRPYEMKFVTTTEFGRLLRERYANAIGTQRGDWTDHWTDGPGSSAYETGVNRATHEIMGAAEAIDAWLVARGGARPWQAARAARTYEDMTLYDEHTWGAYSSIEAPDSLFSQAQWNRKAGYAFTAAMEAHDQLARAANALAKPLGTKGPEGIFNLGDLKPEEAFKPSGIEEVLVINTLPWEREVLVEEPEPRGGAAPVGILDAFFNRGSSWGGARPIPALRRIAGRVPALGYAFLPIAAPDQSDLKVAPGTIENRYFRLTVDPRTGALSSLFDKEQGHEFAATYQGWQPGQYIYEEVDSPEDRLAINNYDFSHPDFFVGHRDTPWKRQVATRVRVGAPKVEQGRASISIEIEAPGISGGSVTYWLDAGSRTVGVDWLIDKLDHPAAEAVFVAFPFNLEGKDFLIDLNGIPAVPNRDQLDGAAKDWYPLQRWVDVSDARRGVTLVPLDAPLVNLGGITTGKWNRTLEPEGPTIMSWALNNHWMVNFKVSQSGRIPLRYRLTTHTGPADPAAAARFAAEVSVPPVVLRDIAPSGSRSDSFFSAEPGQPLLVTCKPAEDGHGIALRLQNLSSAPIDAGVRFSRAPVRAQRSDPIEHPTATLNLAGNRLTVALAPLEIATALVDFGP
ncbi:MAG: glycoside hydrolase family 38 C-terminal domain-containing protein [Devosia sp.]